ncbi:MAG: LuxR C-terminal-related transcriptional regulator [Holosporaceae bacterium]|jgi:tetratricopeptide (TPR) repeat protein/DNA-binding CsgD family transcriptional regulator|nr:LuxR C-terminal-related transcriptional regulator [Holosporaceae bacterium]
MSILWNDDCFEKIGNIEFSHKELCVVALLINGKSYKSIANTFNISEKTVEYHVRSIMQKTKSASKRDIRDFAVASGSVTLLNDYFWQITGQLPLISGKSNFWRRCSILGIGILLMLLTIVGLWQMHTTTKISNIFIQNENYLERQNVIDQVKKILAAQDEIKIAVIIGVGGSGKTSIARRFLQISNPKISWEINAETDSGIFVSFGELAEALAKTKDQKNDVTIIKGISDSQERRRRLVHFVASALRDSPDWFLLFDNVDNFSTIAEYFPQNANIWGKGMVIITTRNRNIYDSSRIRHGTAVDMKPLSPEEQYALFCKIIYRDRTTQISEQKMKEVMTFLAKIPPMPLDLSAAAYYLKNTNSSLEDYLKITEKNTGDFEKIHGKLLEESINYSKTRYGIITSTFAEIIQQNQKFQKLLLCICMLDSQCIPKKLLQNICDSVLVDNFIYNLRKHSLITYDDDKISIHRSTQNIGLNYFMDLINLNEKKSLVQKFISSMTPYEYLDANYNDLEKFIPHLKSLLNKIDMLFIGDLSVDGWKIDLMITVANVYRYKAYRITDALNYFQKVLELNNTCNYLSSEAIALVNLKIGEIHTLMSANDQAMLYLKRSLDLLPFDSLMDLAMNYRLMGIIHMRKDHFDEANNYFKKAIAELEKEKVDSISLMEMKSNIYADMAFNYFMDGINRNNAPKAAEIMKKAIEIIAPIVANPAVNMRVTGRWAVHMSRLAGIYNALGKYDLALKTAQEAEEVIKKLPLDSDLLYAQGIIARERGLSHLRLNKIKEAYDYFQEAKRIFSQAHIGAYLFRLKMHEAEALIRLERWSEALEICEETFALKDRERNNYCDLFFNTCYYHAGLIKYHQNDKNAALKYFEKFFDGMRELCGKIVLPEEYRHLI